VHLAHSCLQLPHCVPLFMVVKDSSDAAGIA